MTRPAIVVLALLVAGGVITSLGTMESGVSAGAVLELWSDVLRDGDQFGLQLTRISDAEEAQLGSDLARSVLSFYPPLPSWQPYVEDVGRALTPHVRRKGVQYRFHALDSPDINAFALPGGHVFIFRGLLETLQTEAELASVLGHEIAHVDARHCVERYQYAVRLKRYGVGTVGKIADLARFLITAGYAQYQELEADGQGMRMSIETGYDPTAATAVFRTLYNQAYPSAKPAPSTPLEELARATASGLSDYFRSHPSGEERMRRLSELTERNRSRLRGRSFYRGRQNYVKRIAQSRQRFVGETVTM
jgi:predicted Zn-dependent protease